MWKMQTDASDFDLNLASLASRAAIALDNLSLGRDFNRAAIRVLAEQGQTRLAEGIPDRVTTLAIFGAMRSRIDAAPSMIGEEFYQNAKTLFDRLLKLDENRPGPTELAELRNFCVDLSRSVSALLSSPFEPET